MIETALISQLTAYGSGSSGLSVVGCEPYDAEQSSMPTYATARIPSVDCIDLPIGELDLTYALLVHDATAYGVKTTATRLVPEAIDEQSGQAAPETHQPRRM
jgi:hypothetical protein